MSTVRTSDNTQEEADVAREEICDERTSQVSAETTRMAEEQQEEHIEVTHWTIGCAQRGGAARQRVAESVSNSAIGS